MPDASEFSTTPDDNQTIGGKYMGTGASPGDVDNVIRYIAAVVRDTFNRIPVVGDFLPRAGGVLTGDISRQGRGAYLHHANGGQSDGRVMFLPQGSPRPTAAEGMVVFYYS